MTYGSIDKKTKEFEGQFILGETTFYVESANKFMDVRDLEGGNIVSIAYSSVDVVRKNGTFEPLALPTAPGKLKGYFIFFVWGWGRERGGEERDRNREGGERWEGAGEKE